MASIGRNEPCPCGSGKKYKRCCIGDRAPSAEEARVEKLHELDRALVVEILGWAEVVEPELFDIAIADLPIPFDDGGYYEHVLQSSLATLAGQEDMTLAKAFLLAEGHELPDRAYAWLEAVVAGWLGLWEILAVRPNHGVRARDLLTGEERDVFDLSLAESASRGRVLCARLVDFEGLSLFVCVHPDALLASQAHAVLEEFVHEDEGTLPYTPDQLRGEDASFLMTTWHEGCMEYRTPVLPTLQNRDGDPAVQTEDVLTFAPADRATIAERLQALPDAHTDAFEDTSGVLQVSFGRDSDDIVIGVARVAADRVTLETTSEARADALLAQVTQALGELATHADRSALDMQDLMASAMGRMDPSEAPAFQSQGPEMDAVVREFKKQSYATWPDEQLPMLGGKTPREGMRDPELRQKIVLTLKDMEAMEAALPEGQRFDVDILREALGIPLDA